LALNIFGDSNDSNDKILHGSLLSDCYIVSIIADDNDKHSLVISSREHGMPINIINVSAQSKIKPMCGKWLLFYDGIYLGIFNSEFKLHDYAMSMQSREKE
jgi:hypothetical protein